MQWLPPGSLEMRLNITQTIHLSDSYCNLTEVTLTIYKDAPVPNLCSLVNTAIETLISFVDVSYVKSSNASIFISSDSVLGSIGVQYDGIGVNTTRRSPPSCQTATSIGNYRITSYKLIKSWRDVTP